MMDTLARLQTRFQELAPQARPGEPSWLVRHREEALERFLERGFPTMAQEEWRFTNVKPLTEVEFGLAEPDADGNAAALLERLRPGEWNRHEIVFVNGRLREDLSATESLPSGVVVTSLSRGLEDHGERLEPVLARPFSDEDTVFSDLNRAFLAEGALVLLPKAAVVDDPIHLVFLTETREPAMSHPRIVIVAEPGSQARIVESYGGAEESVYFTNAVTDVVAGQNAVVDHYKLQRESTRAFHLASLGFVQSRNANVTTHSLSLGGRLTRNDIRAVLDGEGCNVALNGLYVVRGTQHVDHHTVIDHREPHGTSRELYKGILDDEATGVFNGRIIVRPHAQKTDAQQTNKNLLLSKDALVNTNPQLEIHADDVKCAHGATIGQMDAEALFYLRTRGIGFEEARKMLTRGFMADVSDRIRIAEIREALESVLFSEAA